MIPRFCPQCAHPILDVMEEIPSDGYNDAKTIAHCGDCNIMVHVFHLESEPVTPTWVDDLYVIQGDFEGQ